MGIASGSRSDLAARSRNSGMADVGPPSGTSEASMGHHASAYSAAWRIRVAQGDGHRLLDGFWVDPGRAEAVPPASERGLFAGPDGAQRGHALSHSRVPQLERQVGAVVGQLFAVPPHADPEQHPSAGQRIEGRDRAGQIQQVVLQHQTDAGAEFEPRGRGRRRHQRDERIHHMPVTVWELAAARIRRFAAHGDMAVLGHPHGVEAAVFKLLREDIGTGSTNMIQGQVAELHGQQSTPILKI